MNALQLAVVNHDKAVFDALTDYDGDYIGSVDNVDLQQYMQNASDLGALFKTDAVRSEFELQQPAAAEDRRLRGQLGQEINQPGPNDEEVGRMAMLQASLADGVRQGYQQLADQTERSSRRCWDSSSTWPSQACRSASGLRAASRAC